MAEDDGRAFPTQANALPTQASNGLGSAIEGPEGYALLTARIATLSHQLAEANALLESETADRANAETTRLRLLRRLVVAQEQERQRIARDLHDDLGQRLTALRLTLETVATQARDDDQIARGIADALAILGRTDQELDFLAWELRPAALDDLGLTKVLDTYTEEWSRHAGLRAVFHSTVAHLSRFPPEVESAVYRLTQEALNNVAKHAHAGSVNVLLELRGDELVLIVEDDGVGLSTTSSGQTTIGLNNMRERLAAVGGRLELEPTPGGGTTLLAHVPLSVSFREDAHEDGADAALDPGATTPAAHADASASDSRAVNSLRARLAELQNALAARDEFIATVAHELRNPVSPLVFQIRLAIDKTERAMVAGDAPSGDWVRSQLARIEQRLHRLLETLDRLLDVSRLSTGRIDLQPEMMNLAQTMREVMSTFESELAVARCHVTFAEHGDSTGWWDRMRVEQIGRNLLSNAIRFGAGRPIAIDVEGDPDFATLRVRDQGIGIAPALHARIFERFERGAERRSGGFGIGLWIVKSICMAMGGTIAVESEPGEGACFTVMLPRHDEHDPVGRTEHT